MLYLQRRLRQVTDRKRVLPLRDSKVRALFDSEPLLPLRAGLLPEFGGLLGLLLGLPALQEHGQLRSLQTGHLPLRRRMPALPPRVCSLLGHRRWVVPILQYFARLLPRGHRLRALQSLMHRLSLSRLLHSVLGRILRVFWI